MSVKENVLNILEKQKQTPISGEEIARLLGCTRAAVSKAVKELCSCGYDIEAVNKVGYTLKVSGDVLSKAFIEERLKQEGFSLAVITEKQVDSTNNLAKALAMQGVRDDLVIIAEEQTAGRGRKGRSFYSPKGTGIYFSFLLHPRVPVSEAAVLTTLAVTAEALAIEKLTGHVTDIKWVNDLYYNGKKVSGILTEGQTSMEEDSLDYVIVGIGINLYEPREGFPEEIKDVAGALYPFNEKKENLRNLVASEVIINLLKYYKTFPERSFLKDYEKRCTAIGKDVTIISSSHDALAPSDGPDRIHARVLGIDQNCHLHVKYADGKEDFLFSGEISICMN